MNLLNKIGGPPNLRAKQGDRLLALLVGFRSSSKPRDRLFRNYCTPSYQTALEVITYLSILLVATTALIRYRRWASLFLPVAVALTFGFALPLLGQSMAHAPGLIIGLLLVWVYMAGGVDRAEARWQIAYVFFAGWGRILLRCAERRHDSRHDMLRAHSSSQWLCVRAAKDAASRALEGLCEHDGGLVHLLGLRHGRLEHDFAAHPFAWHVDRARPCWCCLRVARRARQA